MKHKGTEKEVKSMRRRKRRMLNHKTHACCASSMCREAERLLSHTHRFNAYAQFIYFVSNVLLISHNSDLHVMIVFTMFYSIAYKKCVRNDCFQLFLILFLFFFSNKTERVNKIVYVEILSRMETH